MKTDSCYFIGKDHRICEDYAISGVKNNIAYAIVSDGCSASLDVDFGSRVLALSARETLQTLTEDVIEDVNLFGVHTLGRARKACGVFESLSYQTLDATLLVAFVKNKTLKSYLFGDGVLVHKTKDTVNLVHIHLTSGAPDYLSYNMDPLRRQAYDKEWPDNKKEITINNDGMFTMNPFTPFEYECQVEDGDVISVISDGINSFRKHDGTVIDWKELVNEFTGYKTTEGQFVLRRMSAFKNKCLKEGIVHSDDISIASIIV